MNVRHIDLGFVNCYLIKGSNGFVLVDTGIRARREVLDAALAAAGCKPGDLKLIILTHGDIDHSGNGAYLRERFGAPIAMHAADSPMVETGEVLTDRQVNSVLMKLVQSAMRLLGGAKRMTAGFEKFKPDLYLEDGQELAEWGLEATVLHIPGHTPGSIAILFADGNCVCGDTLRNGKPAAIVDNASQLAVSVDRLVTLGLKTVYPGHGKPFPWG